MEQVTLAQPLDHDDDSLCVSWLQEAEASVLMVHGRQVLRYGGVFNDRNGYLTSLEDAFREARQLASCYELNEHSFESVIVELRFIRIPVLAPNKPPLKLAWNSEHPYFQYDLVDNLAILNKQGEPTYLKREVVEENVCAWSSKEHMSISRETLYNFRQHWDFTLKPTPNRTPNIGEYRSLKYA